MLFDDKIFTYDEESLEYHEEKGYIIINIGLAYFLTIVFFFMVLFSFATLSKYLEAKQESKTAKEVVIELNSQLQQSELDLYYWKENQLIQNKKDNN